MEEKKIFGIYPGSLKDVEYIKNCSEQTLYFLINTLGGFIWRMNHDMAHGRITENVDLTEQQYAIEFCVYQSKRFGTEILEAEGDEHIKNTPSYWAWFRWWNSYFQEELTVLEYEEYDKLCKEKKDISKFRPTGNWKDNIEKKVEVTTV